MNWIPPDFPVLDAVTKQFLAEDYPVDFSSLKFVTSSGSG